MKLDEVVAVRASKTIYRDGDKVITKYVGKDEESLVPIREQLARRKQVEEIIKKLKEEKAQIKKLEAVL